MVDLKAIGAKWQAKWAEAKVFEANPDNRPKFFLNFPYPYINAYQHIGHLFTLMRVEAFARYKRLQGFNVLFPQGWHATGSPIVQAAKRVKDREEKQIKIMKDMGFSEEDLPKFEKPEYWIEFFAPEFKKDYDSIGMSIDWRREFHTTSLNPRYDKFIQWQFRKLKEKGYVVKGKFPVVWDPQENVPVGDHDRIEGEGETPQEFLLLKHKLDDNTFIMTATLRADTCMGITNLYVHPEQSFVNISINNETWIVSEHCAHKLKEQGNELTIGDEIKATDLLGKTTEELDGHTIPILPATFVDPKFGTGIVHSCPAESADDLIALYDLQKNEGFIKQFKLDPAQVAAVVPIPVLKTEGFSDTPAKDFLEKYKVTSQKQKKQLDQIKKELYKVSFHTAVFNDKYKTFFSEDLEGKPVSKYQKQVESEIIDKGWGSRFYQLTGKVVARSLAECIVKIVDDQWFMNYADPAWKKLAHECLDNMKLFPEKARTQFDYVIDWLHQWACTREAGLGTRLPWDEKWLIESLSDSTIYLAYYTFVHILNEIDVDNIDDDLFDYVLLGKETKHKVDNMKAAQMREQFNYFYPVDFRNSGKDLIQNHLTFFIFNHTAIFPKDKWPQGIGVNGWVTVDGQKMSKSLGNMVPVRQVVAEHGPDAPRLTILSGGESMDDPNWDTNLFQSLPAKFTAMVESVKDLTSTGRDDRADIDNWAESRLHTLIKEATHAMEQTMFRTAINKIFFDLSTVIKLYLKNTDNNPNKALITKMLESQIIMLYPFTPHICEEMWELLGKSQMVTYESWPAVDESKINAEADMVFDLIEQTKTDISAVMKLMKQDKAETVTIFVADQWKYDFLAQVIEKIKDTRDMKALMDHFNNSELKEHMPAIVKQLPRLIKNMSKLPSAVLSQEKELHALEKAIPVLAKRYNADIMVVKEQTSDHQKAAQAMPGKAAIVIE